MSKQYEHVRGHNIYTKVIGEGEPIVFLHGGPGSDHRIFLPHVEPLAEQYTLYFYDQSGCGHSSTKQSTQYTIKEEVEMLESLRKVWGMDKLNLVGESWGTMLALMYATTYPERVHKLFLTAVIGVDAKGYKEFPKQLNKRMNVQDSVRFWYHERKGNTQQVLSIMEPYYVYNPGVLTRKKKQTMNKTVNEQIGKDIAKQYNVQKRAHQLTSIPVRIVQGSHDILTPSMVYKSMKRALPHAEFIRLEECGHWSFVERPRMMNHLLQEFMQVT